MTVLWFGYPPFTALGPWPMTLGTLPLDQTDENGSAWNVTEFTGKGSPPAEVEVNQRQTDHGAWIRNALWAAKPYSITGAFEGDTELQRWEAEQRLIAAVGMGRATTTLVFHEEVERQTEVVLSGEIEVTPSGVYAFTFVMPLVAPDPFRYSTTERAINATLNSTSLALPNTGTAAAWPVFTVTTAATLPDVTLTRDDTDQYLTVDNPSGDTLTAGQTLTVDMRRRRITIGGTSRRSWMTGEWFGLPPGVQTTVVGTSTAGSGTYTATYRDVWL